MGSEYALNGPPALGRFVHLIVNCTPIPLGLATAVTVPWIFPPSGYAALKNGVPGKVAL